MERSAGLYLVELRGQCQAQALGNQRQPVRFQQRSWIGSSLSPEPFTVSLQIPLGSARGQDRAEAVS